MILLLDIALGSRGSVYGLLREFVDPEPRACGALTSQRCTVSSAYIWEAVLDKKKNILFDCGSPLFY
jgi:hypothetical protein